MCKCSCSIGFNGKFCHHQAPVLKKFNILNICNTMTAENKLKFYNIATGKQPNSELFLPLQYNNKALIPTTTNATALSSVNQTSVINNVSTVDNPIEEASSTISADLLQKTQDDWKSYSEEILKNINDDPDLFLPAISRFLENKNKHGNNVNKLLTHFHTAFKPRYEGPKSRTGTLKLKTKLRGPNISVQPTSIGRRKIRGKLNHVGRPSTGVIPKSKTKAQHSLSKCVESNIGLGGNKQRK